MVYVADNANHLLRQVTPAGVLSTIGGTGSPGTSDAFGTAEAFFNPRGVAIDPGYNLYVADSGNRTIRTGVPANPFGSLGISATSIDFGGQSMNTTSPPAAVVLSNVAVAVATISSITVSAGFDVTHACRDIGYQASCTVNVTFTPAAPVNHTGTLMVASSLGTRTVTLTCMGTALPGSRGA